MASGGLLWFGDSMNQFSQKVSHAIDELEDGEQIKEIITEALEKGTERMEEIVLDGGMNKTKKGGPRAESEAMFDSIDYTTSVNGRGRFQGEFGFLDGAPEYTKYQEYGTGSSGAGRAAPGKSGPSEQASGGGISAMLAFATANQEVITSLQNQLDSGQWFPTSLR